jgi:hypothetical protein
MEKALTADYYNKKNLLHAQTWLLKLDNTGDQRERDGMLWFHKMRSYFDEGINSQRWEGFLRFSKNYIKEDRVNDVTSHALEYGWPVSASPNGKDIFLKDEITWMIDSLNSFREKRNFVQDQRPPENTNYKIRYYLILFFLVALALKFLKIYADYRRNTDPN